MRHLVLALATLLSGAAAAQATGGGAHGTGCAPPHAGPSSDAQIARVLRAKRDVWGDTLLARPNGPTYEAVRRYLGPLLLGRAAKRSRLTPSGFHYLAFSQPVGAAGAGAVALHVADGSEIVSQRTGGARLSVGVGALGRERFGSCLARLTLPRLHDGYLPILETGYADAAGVRYTQESFAARDGARGVLVSYVRIGVDARHSTVRAVHVRLTPSVGTRLRAVGDRLEADGKTYLLFERGGMFDGTSLDYEVERGTTTVLRAAWLNTPSTAQGVQLDAASYDAAKRAVTGYWERRLAAGASIVVPERRVLDAERNLLVQDLGLTWRYSIGNAYEEFSFPEGVDVAEVLGGWGFEDVDRAILRMSLRTRPTPYPNWKMGQKLVGSALHYRRYRDGAYVDEVTPVLRGYVEDLGRQLDAGGRGLLHRERYSSDIPDSVFGLHSQAVAWQGLRLMGQAWGETGHADLAARCRSLAARLGAGLHRAVAASERPLPDGSLFIPVQLLDRVDPYASVTATRLGSYWNLVMPYALASGLFPPGSREATGAWRYLRLHGSRLLGLVRAGAYALYGREAPFPVSGTDQVYGTNVARFLADNDRPDQLVLSLYGQLAAAMAPGTFVAGEAASVAPLRGAAYRAMYLPPNGASNAAFLETLRLLLVHETLDRAGEPRGLELAFATPRPWLRPGRRIDVRRVPTSFGPLSYSLEAARRAVRVSLELPGRARLPAVSLRLRLPDGRRIEQVALDGRPYTRFDRRSATIRLPLRRGHVDLEVGTS